MLLTAANRAEMSNNSDLPRVLRGYQCCAERIFRIIGYVLVQMMIRSRLNEKRMAQLSRNYSWSIYSQNSIIKLVRHPWVLLIIVNVTFCLAMSAKCISASFILNIGAEILKRGKSFGHVWSRVVNGWFRWRQRSNCLYVVVVIYVVVVDIPLNQRCKLPSARLSVYLDKLPCRV